MSITTELIAKNKTTKEISKYIDADEVFFIEIKDIDNIFQNVKTCKACFDGNYPTKIYPKEWIWINESTPTSLKIKTASY